MSSLPISYVLVALGSALGGVARHWLTALVGTRIESPFPWGTLLVNATGSLLIGVAAALLLPPGRWSGARDFVMVGVLGGYTTFSAFSLQTLGLLQGQRFWAALLYAGGSVFICLFAVALGYFALRTLQA